MKYSSTFLFTLAAIRTSHDVMATFTIAAADRATGQIGASGSSCVDTSLYNVAYQSVPGHGLCMTQAMPPSNPKWDEGASFMSPVYGMIDSLLSSNTDPQMIIDVITDPSLDSETFMGLFDAVNLRQYGCVDLERRAAGYTGKDLDRLYYYLTFGAENVQEDAQGTHGDSIVYSAQGNIVSKTTVSTLSNTFESAEACDLVERLYLSLAAVYEADAGLIGDIRCFNTNNAAGSSVFIHVENSEGSEIIHIENESPSAYIDPWSDFKSAYKQWRSENPCSSVQEFNHAISY
ncbi:hypothetical protein HJC23_011273 [Cyclotella cryptica]|uniref:Uncharacterized protein n=1 Tax=Cyclotella cryptica TaxID=29204 RepID=A0ABD3R2A8_9STRA|eukprot:CCRYP_001675-RA/>CCRYP_001675-RA protein AED:0.00 eAED:0.00 QI:132/-1/1/1/-1/1/1/178/289